MKHAAPENGKELPSGIFCFEPPPFAAYGGNYGKNLFRRDRSLQNGLIIPGQIIKAVFNPADTVQDKLTIFSLIQNDVTGNGRVLGSLQTDRVSLVNQEWCHTAAGDIQTDRFAIKNQRLQNGQISSSRDCFHKKPPL